MKKKHKMALLAVLAGALLFLTGCDWNQVKNNPDNIPNIVNAAGK